MDSVNSTRCVGIEICNKTSSKVLTEPKTYIYSGLTHTPPDDTIHQGKKGVCIFRKYAYSVCGAVGVLSYRFGNSQISLLVSNPYNYFGYRIEYALYVSDKTIPTDSKLYNKMYDELPESASFKKTSLVQGKSSLNITKEGIYVSATMTNEKKAILKIDIRDA